MLAGDRTGSTAFPSGLSNLLVIMVVGKVGFVPEILLEGFFGVEMFKISPGVRVLSDNWTSRMFFSPSYFCSSGVGAGDGTASGDRSRCCCTGGYWTCRIA